MAPFPVCLCGHTLKYETECICKIFLPLTKFTFFYDTSALPPEAPEGAVLVLTQSGDGQTRFSVTLSLHGTTKSIAAEHPHCTPAENKAACEYYFARLLFSLFRDITGQNPPWGILTGIRPVKKVQTLLRQGMGREEIVRHMLETYWVHSEKTALAYDIAMRQEPILQATPQDAVCLYISVPFCPTRCSYCSFVSHAVEQSQKLIPAYVKYLCRELEIWGELVRDMHLSLDSVYLGGGTPTTLTPAQLQAVLSAVARAFDLSHVREYCVEAGRPDTITKEKLDVLRAFSVSRLCVNPQTMEDDVLRAIGRRHTAAQTTDAFRLARAMGFGNINMDLIAGLPTDTPTGFQKTLRQIFARNPESITVHALTLKRASRLFADGEAQIENPVAAMVNLAERELPRHGFMPYYLYRQKNTIENLENVGFAKEGHESLYNILIMDDSRSILGAGCGASTKIIESGGKITRLHNYKFPYEYIDRFEELMEKKKTARELLARANNS